MYVLILICWIVIYLGPVVQKVDCTIQWIVQLLFVLLIRWIAIYPVYSAIHVLNNQGLVDSDIQHLSN